MFGHQKNVWRLALLLGLVALFVVMGGDAWAQQYLMSTETPNTFPYLSPDITQRNLLINAYALQMLLFSAINGSGVGMVKTFYYLALTGVLVGSLLVIFNPKYRRPTILASWLLLVIITIFAPLGSSLLFYPVDKGTLKGPLLLGSEYKGCVETPQRCGFAPQLAAIHIAATMQLTMSDIFRSLGWKGLIDNFIADRSLEESKFMVLPDDFWDDVQKYSDRRCGYSYEDLSNHIVGVRTLPEPTATNNAAATRVAPITLGTRWQNDIERFYSNAEADNTRPPPAITLFSDDEFETAYAENHWNGDDKKAYEAGLTQLYKTFTSGVDGDAAVNRPVGIKGVCPENACASTPLTADEALGALEKAGFFKITTNSGANWLEPGFFFTWSGSANSNEASHNDIGDFTADYGRQCYLLARDNPSDDLERSNKITWCNTAGANLNAAAHIRFMKEIAQGDFDLYPSWAKLYPILTGENPDKSAIFKMPVGRKRFDFVKTGAAVNPDDNTSSYVPTATTASVDVCKDDGIKMINELVDIVVEQATDFDNLKPLLVGDMPVPAELKIENLATHVLGSAAQERAKWLVNAFNTAMQLQQQIHPEEPLTDPQRKAVILRTLVERSQTATLSSIAAKKPKVGEQENAAEDATKTDVHGWSWLTSLGSGAATVLGTWILKIGSNFIGPLAAAVVYFISLLVDFAMMAIIVLTPFLFLAGLFIPSVALGVMTVAVLGAFLLKFVPVTLIILNNLAMMLYQFLGAGGEGKGDVMQSMLILAMSGLYMNLVGLTFFLIFKLGDPSAILGRLTALDGSAKQMGETGMRAAKALAATAASLATAGAVGGGAALVGRMGLMAKAGAKAAGVPGDVVDAVGNAVMKPASAKEEDGVIGPIGDNLTDEERAKRDALMDMDDPNARAEKAALAEEELKDKRFADPRAAEIMKAAKLAGLSDDEAAKLARDGSVITTDKYGKQWKYSHDGDPNDPDAKMWALNSTVPVASTTSNQSSAATGNMFGPQTRSQFDTNPDDFKAAPISAAEVPMSADAKIQSMLEAKAKAEASGEVLLDANGKPIASATAVAGAGAASAATVATTAGGGPLQVQVMGGELNKVGEIQGLNEAMTAGGKSVDQIESDKAKENAAAMREANEKMMQSKDLTPETKDRLAQENEALLKAETRSDVQASKDRTEKILKEAGTTVGAQQAKESYRRNMNDQVAQELASVERDLKTSGFNGKKKEDLEALQKLLLNTDTAALTQGELMQRMGSVESLKESMALRGLADSTPGKWDTFKSGVYGAMGGVGGGLARIPVVGHAISEALNEVYQAPERARAWNTAGGFMSWRAAQKDAQRLGFYQKEMGPIAAAHQYNSMVAVGGFQAQADLARQAASEAVAKSRSQFEALAAHTKDQGKNVLTQNFMTANDLAGLGRLEAADRVTSVRQEAYFMQGAPLTVQRAVRTELNADGKEVVMMRNGKAVSALDDNLNLIEENGKPVTFKAEEASVVFTPESMNRIRGDLSAKRITKTFDDMMITHYGLAEKQYLRGDAEWNMARNMTRSVEAAAAFSRKDISTDYLIGGHMNMVTGKERFLEGKGQYEKLVEFRNTTNKLVNTQVAEMLGAVSGNIQQALKDFKIDPSKFNFSSGAAMVGQDLAVQQKAQLEKKAVEALREKGVFDPLNALFHEAGTSGSSKYMQRAEMAFYNMANQDAQRLEKVSRAAGDYLRSKMPTIRDLDKGFNLESDGRRVKFDKAGDVIARGVMEMLSTQIIKGVDMSAHSQKGIDIMREIIEDEQKNYGNALSVGSEKVGSKIHKTWTGVSERVMDRWTKSMSDIDGRMDAQIKAFKDTQYKKGTVAGTVDFASYERGQNGNNDKIFNEAT